MVNRMKNKRFLILTSFILHYNLNNGISGLKMYKQSHKYLGLKIEMNTKWLASKHLLPTMLL